MVNGSHTRQRRSARLDLNAVVFLVMLLAQAAVAGPPFVTDDPEVPLPASWEVNIPMILERSSDGDTIQTPLLDINYGYSADLQLKVEFALLLRACLEGTQYATGLGDTSVGAKWRFLDESAIAPEMALYPQVVIPTGNPSRELGDGKPAYKLPVVAQKSLGPWTIFSNVGLVLQTSSELLNYWYYGVGAVRAVAAGIELGCELFGNSVKEVGERRSVGLNLGGSWELAEGRRLLVSAGRTISGERTTMVYLGLQLLAGGDQS
jgi:hypothetical protein